MEEMRVMCYEAQRNNALKDYVRNLSYERLHSTNSIS